MSGRGSRWRVSGRVSDFWGSSRGGPWRAGFGLLLAIVVAQVWAAGLGAGPAGAHTLGTEGFSTITQRGEDVRYELLVDYTTFAIVAGVGEPGNASPDLAVAERDLRDGADKAAEYLDRHLQVLVDGVPCAARIDDTGVEERFEQPYASIVLLYDCPGSGEYEIRYSVLVGDLDPDHTNLADYNLDGGSGEFVFDAETEQLVVGDASVLRQGYRFGVVGFHHILGGLDHILFVVALLIGASRARDVLAMVTTFTLAHSTTLVLAAVDLVRVPAALVEPLIALSILYVAAANTLDNPRSTHRLAAVFGFGLLHGLGFAGALQVTGEMDWSSVSSLLSFNVGIEFGQALIVALFLPLLLYTRRFTWSRYAHLGATGVIALIGLAWFVERVFMG
jgi:hydrogenase/urease accessory protein HupE